MDRHVFIIEIHADEIRIGCQRCYVWYALPDPSVEFVAFLNSTDCEPIRNVD